MQNSDYIAIASAMIALFAMGATFWQAWVTRRHNYLSIRPLLVWHIARKNSSADAQISFHLKNKGIGPAIVTDRYFTVKGQRFKPSKPQTDEVLELIQSVLGQAYKYEVRQWGLPGKDAALLPQEEVVVACITFPAMSHESLSAVMNAINYVEFYLDYESLYGHKWKLRTDSSRNES